MWPFKCQKIRHRKKRIQSRIEMVEYKVNEIRKKYFVLENCFGYCYEDSRLFPSLNDWKFSLPVHYFYNDIKYHVFYTNEELIFNKVKELIKEYEGYQNQLRNLHKFLEILK
jgi:hypothetical protein